MNDAILRDTLQQVDNFAEQVRMVLDPGKYPSPDFGPEFDTTLQYLEREFERVKRVCHDCLMAQWSDHIGQELRQKLASSRPETVGDTEPPTDE